MRGAVSPVVGRTLSTPAARVRFPGCEFFFLNMLRQYSQYDSRLGFSFRVLVRDRVRLGLG